MRGLGYPSAIASSLHQLPRRDECIAVNTFLHNEVKLYITFNVNYYTPIISMRFSKKSISESESFMAFWIISL
jgi:hypothetical protein